MGFQKKTKMVAPLFQAIGAVATINSQAITVTARNAAGLVTECYGTVTITDAGAGYAKGCRYVKTDGGVATTLFINEGSTSSCDFNAMETSASSVTGVTAGTGLTGGGSEGSVTVNAGAGRGVAVRADAIDVAIDVYNNTGGTLAVGTLVYLTGFTTTNGVTVAKADADAGLKATHVVADAILNNAAGVVYPVATVTGLATNGTTIGDPVYMDATTAGAFVFSAPTGADQMVQIVGVVKVVHASTGEIVFFPGADRVTKLPTSAIQDSAVTATQLASNAVTTAKILDANVTEPKVVGSVGVGGLFVKKHALVVYDFAVDGGVVGAIPLTGSPTIPDNAVVHVESYDVLTTVTTAGADAGTLTLGFPTDGDLFTAIAVSDGSNPWDAGVFVKGTGALVDASQTPKKLTGARTFILTAGGQAITAGKVVFQVSYWISQ